MKNKPRIRFCWQCGRKLLGNHHEMMLIDGYEKILHKTCAKALKQGEEAFRTSEEAGMDYPDGPWARGWENRKK
jgi:hypothetical protein